MQPTPPQLSQVKHFSLFSQSPSRPLSHAPQSQIRPQSAAPSNPPEYAQEFHSEGVTLLPPVSSTPVGPAHYPPYATDAAGAYPYHAQDGGEKGEKAVPPVGYEYQEPQGTLVQFPPQQGGKVGGLKRFFGGDGAEVKGHGVGVGVKTPGTKILKMFIWFMVIGFMVSATFVAGVLAGRRMECAPYYGGRPSGDYYGYSGYAGDTSGDDDDSGPFGIESLRQGLAMGTTLPNDLSSSSDSAMSATSATGAASTVSSTVSSTSTSTSSVAA